MGFQSVNEIGEFRFDDCVICEMKAEPSQLVLTLDALIVCANNSQNGNFTDSYADTAVMRLVGGRILSGVKDGYRYYDANEVLVDEVADTPLDEDFLKGFPKRCAGAYLYGMDREPSDGEFCYTLCIEFADEEEQAMGDSYQIKVAFEKAIVSWERYRNRVQG